MKFYGNAGGRAVIWARPFELPAEAPDQGLQCGPGVDGTLLLPDTTHRSLNPEEVKR
ncbi:MAG: hypothetical protein HYY85_07280 [Deltaproteobacteria bacterium]|nr:hypothetical protein [Deltaproteobacteria bacterium]